MKKRSFKVAPFEKYMHMEILEIGEGFARVRMPYRDEFTNPAGKIHGGVIASLVDTAMAVAVFSLVGPGVRYSTVRLEIKYKAPVRDGEMLAEAKINIQKKRLFKVEAAVKDGDGQVAATATATFMLTNQGH
ncbi:MAG: PaaI family thioesterase [Deltaproteobacteria bacterium]|nr:PaaI family thioesterase [Deltaproteobacteria bacterium]